MQRISLDHILLSLASVIAGNDTDIKKKFRAAPKLKPPRRKPSIQNESDQHGYMKDYMQEYRGEGKDYQKTPDKLKKFRSEQRKKIKEKFDLK